MPRTTTSVNRSKQTSASTAAKIARLEEAGLGGRRVGKASATTKVVQAKRDARKEKAAKLEKSKAKTPVRVRSGTGTASGTIPAKTPRVVKKAPTSPPTPRATRSTPLIQVRTSASIDGSAKLDAHTESVVAQGLSRFAARLTRIDVYLNDVNAEKKGSDDKNCRIEARPASAAPVSVAAAAPTVEKAIVVAVGKMKRLLAGRFDKQTRR